jgi:hypothetical protein
MHTSSRSRTLEWSFEFCLKRQEIFIHSLEKKSIVALKKYFSFIDHKKSTT